MLKFLRNQMPGLLVVFFSPTNLQVVNMPRRMPYTHHRLSTWLRLAALFLLPYWAGCSTILSTPPVEYQSLFNSVETSPDSVTLEIFQVRVPANEPKLVKNIWQAIDEQRLDIELRREMARNGFRAGVLGSTLPDELARQLNLQSEMPEASSDQVVTGENANPRITRRVLQLSRHEPAIIQTADVQPELVVMLSGKDGIRGSRYQEVEAVYSMRAEKAPGQSVLVRLTPELRHGELRPRYSGSAAQGIFLMMPSREREIFDQLKISTELAAGDTLVISCLAEEEGSLGHAFHGIDRNGPAEQKLVLIRVMHVPGSEILAEADH